MVVSQVHEARSLLSLSLWRVGASIALQVLESRSLSLEAIRSIAVKARKLADRWLVGDLGWRWATVDALHAVGEVVRVRGWDRLALGVTADEVMGGQNLRVGLLAGGGRGVGIGVGGGGCVCRCGCWDWSWCWSWSGTSSVMSPLGETETQTRPSGRSRTNSGTKTGGERRSAPRVLVHSPSRKRAF